MILEQLPFSSTNAFGKLFIDYINKKESLNPFYANFPDKENFLENARNRVFSNEKREVLVSVLTEQYKNLSVSDATQKNIEALKNSNTFTITTGHQLCLAGGPFYFVYKIITAIKSCSELNESQKEFKFVPVFWMASEDHDFEEINHFYLFGKKQTWTSEQKGGVGKFSLEDLKPLIESISDLPDFIKNAYLSEKNLADATRNWVNTLFSEQGLVILDADHPKLKAEFSEIIKSDIFENKAIELVAESSEKLIAAGYSAQVTPREINFFYLENGLRERIIKENEHYKVNNTDIVFSKSELEELLLKNPEKFSPNVIFRPIYQEVVLPNVSYIGGPGELAYWLQLKSTFDFYKVPFPLLQPRNFFLYVFENLNKRIEKFGFTNEDLFKDLVFLKEKYKSENDLKVSFEEEKKQFSSLFEELRLKVRAIDPTLEGTVLAEIQKNHTGLEIINKKTDKAIEQKNEQAISQIVGLKEKLFPEGNLQERHDNFLTIFINKPDFIKELIEKTNPLGYEMNVVRN